MVLNLLGVHLRIGVNLFVADLPIAVGFEYGCSFQNYGAGKFKYDYDEYIGGVSSSGTYYTSLIDDFEAASANEFANNDVAAPNTTSL